MEGLDTQSKEILESDVPDVDKLARVFELRTREHRQRKWQRELELAKAMRDDESTAKAHIKLDVLRSTMSIFSASYGAVTGRREWHE